MKNSGNDSLKAQLERVLAENKKLCADNNELRALIDALQEQNKLFAQMLFGASSEKAEKILPDDHIDKKSANDDSENNPGSDTKGGSISTDANKKANSGKTSKSKGGRNTLPKH